MKKNFKFMLVALLAVLGFGKASAQFSDGGKVNVGYYTYEISNKNAVKKTADAKLLSWTANPMQTDGSIALPGTFSYADGTDNYTVTVTEIANRNAYDAKSAVTNVNEANSIVIPKEIVKIGEGAFWGCSAVTSITFEAGSKVQTIGSNCFATTQIKEFDFSPCEELQGLSKEVFVQTGLNNTYITKVKLPTGPLFKHIGEAFQNLKNLTTIENLDQSYVQEIVASAFKGCDKLTTLSLPGNNLQYIDKAALKDSKIETLSIDVSSLKSLGGGTVATTDPYGWTAEAATTNLYDQNAVDETPLKSLTLTGKLTGVIAKNAFSWCDKLNGVLDLTGVTFGSTGQIAGEAFFTCVKDKSGITGVKIGDITDNRSGDPAIAADAFKGSTLLATVVIGNITTANAIGAKAFGDQLKDVTIGTVKADGAAFAASAFVWKKVSEATLSLAQGEGQFLNANTITSPIIVAQAFDMSAITGLTDTEVYPVIKIGEIRSLGGVFAEGAIKPAATTKELTFTGAIADNGIDKQIFGTTAYTGLTAITFDGAIGAKGIAKDAFKALTKINTLTFNGLLKENAVDEDAFKFTDDAAITEVVNYTCATIPDYTVNPFHKKAFGGTAVGDTRFITLKVTNEKLQAYFANETIGLTTDGKFDVYLVKAMVAEDATTFLVYQDGTSKLAWGRYDLGSFTVENTDNLLKTYTATNMEIPRYQEVQDGAATVKLTIYGVYTDCNPKGGADFKGESSVYMVPLQVIDGNYIIKNDNKKTLIIRAEAISGAFTDKDVKIAYEVPTTAPTTTSVWTELPDFDANRGFKKNQTTAVVTTQILWDRTAAATYDVWGSDAEFAKKGVAYKDYAPKSIYSLVNPANYKGFDVLKIDVSENSGKIGINWYYAILPNYGKTGEASAARIVWMSEDDATAIFGVKNVNSIEAENGAIYNLAGQKVDASYKGIVIKNGKKMIQK